MDFKVDVDIRQLVRKVEAVSEEARDLRRVLRRMGGKLIKNAQAKVADGDFAPLAASTIAHRARHGLEILERKLGYDLRRARLRSKGKRSRGIINREAVLAEFRARHGMVGGGEKLQRAQLSGKQLTSLGRRTDRAVARQVNKAILGGLPWTLKMQVGATEVIVTAKTGGEWSAVHNEGGQAGHGARIPKREFLKADDDDLKELAEILKEHFVRTFNRTA